MCPRPALEAAAAGFNKKKFNFIQEKLSQNFLQAGVRRREQQLEEGRFPGQADVHPGLEGGGRRSEVQMRQDCPEVQQRGHLRDLHAVAVLQVGAGYRGLCSGVTKIWRKKNIFSTIVMFHT